MNKNLNDAIQILENECRRYKLVYLSLMANQMAKGIDNSKDILEYQDYCYWLHRAIEILNNHFSKEL